MASTLSGDVFIPEIAAATATAQFQNELAIGFTGSPLVRDLGEIAERYTTEGEQIKFPRWNPLGEMTRHAQGTPATPEKLDSSVNYAPLVSGEKAVEIEDWAALTAAGNPSEEVGNQMATVARRFVDAELMDRALLTELVVDNSDGGGSQANAVYDAFTEAIWSQWGDRAKSQVGGLVVTPASALVLETSTEFKSADFRDVMEIVQSGDDLTMPIGVINNYPVFVSGRLPDDGTDSTNLIFKRGAMGIKWKRRLAIEMDRDILAPSDVIVGRVWFAAHQLFGEPRTVIRWVTDNIVT